MAELTPNDIINKEFRRSFRGYSTEEVDDFLQQISDSLALIMEENKGLIAQANDLRERLKQFQQIEELMKNALLLAERSAEEARKSAHQEADLIRREAEQKLAEERNALEEVRQKRLRAIAELRAMLAAHFSMLDDEERRTAVSFTTKEAG